MQHAGINYFFEISNMNEQQNNTVYCLSINDLPSIRHKEKEYKVKKASNILPLWSLPQKDFCVFIEIEGTATVVRELN